MLKNKENKIKTCNWDKHLIGVQSVQYLHNRELY